MPKPTKCPSVHDVTLAALLHDIGKLIEYTDSLELTEEQQGMANEMFPEYHGTRLNHHALYTNAFFDWVESKQMSWPDYLNPDILRKIAVYHHQSQRTGSDLPSICAAEIVSAANQIAVGCECQSKDTDAELSVVAGGVSSKRLLKAIVPALDLGKTGPDGHYLPLPLDADNLLPRPDSECKENDDIVPFFRKVWNRFKCDLCDLLAVSQLEPVKFEEGLLGLIEVCLWGVPSSLVNEPDIPLLDHSRTVAAFSAALYNYHAAHDELCCIEAIGNSKIPKFRFIVGDLSGLQSTLFQFQREQVTGMNRLLRGRSLRFQLIAKAAIRHILKTFEMPFSAALQTAGGRFLLLLPELGEEEMQQKTAYLRDYFDECLAREYSGQLGLGLALSDPFAAHDLVQGRDKTDESMVKIRAQKLRDKLNVTVETAKFKQLRKPAVQAVQMIDFPHGVCGACGRRPAEGVQNNEDPVSSYCLTCKQEEQLGQLYSKKPIVLTDNQNCANKILGFSFHKDDVNNPTSSDAFRYCYVPRFSESDINKYQSLEGHAGIKKDDVKTFEVLAIAAAKNEEGESEKGKGKEMLALLKADIDRLGQLFVKGDKKRWSLARSAALSRIVDAYFSLRLPDVLKRKFQNIYTVYAGGDDLLLLGPWTDIFEFADWLQNDFTKFSLGNPSVTLSAGIALFAYKSPVAAAAREAEKRLSDVKTGGRNRVSAIESSPMSWDIFRQSLADAQELHSLVCDGTLSTAALYRFLALSEAASRAVKNTAFPEDYAWRAKLGYTLARNLPKYSDDARKTQAFDLIIRLFGLNRGLEDVARVTAGTQLALTHTIYRNR